MRLPSFTTLGARARKPVKQEPALGIPEGLQTQYIRRWESIPDDYILQNFVIEEHRQEKRRVAEELPLFKLLIEQLVNRPLSVTEPNRRDNDFDDDDDDAYGRNMVDGQEVSIQQLKNVLINFLDSEATLALFDKARIYYLQRGGNGDDEEYYPNRMGSIRAYPCEILLCKEDVKYETDRVVIDRLKREVFAKITRWRRAKERF